MKNNEWINFKCYLLTFEITKDIKLSRYHGSKIVSLLSQIFKHPLTDEIPSPIIPYSLEMGRFFGKGELYPLELTILGTDNKPLLDIFNWFLNDKKNIKAGDFATYLKLTHVKDITPVFVEENKIDDLIHLKLLTPLRHAKRIKSDGKRFFSPDFFDPEYFLELYYKRLVMLSEFYGQGIPRIRKIPRCKLISIDCNWIDDKFSKTLGGIVGEVKFNMKNDKYWNKVLWLGQFMHAGNNTNFGFGKYLLINS